MEGRRVSISATKDEGCNTAAANVHQHTHTNTHTHTHTHTHIHSSLPAYTLVDSLIVFLSLFAVAHSTASSSPSWTNLYNVGSKYLTFSLLRFRMRTFLGVQALCTATHSTRAVVIGLRFLFCGSTADPEHLRTVRHVSIAVFHFHTLYTLNG